MVVVLAPEHVDVYCAARCDRERVEDVGEHLGAQVADLLAFEPEVGHTERARANVDDCTGERLGVRAVRQVN
jgi:hypothetical protein